MKKKVYAFRSEFQKQASVAVIAAFGFLIALSWRDFVSEVVNKIVARFDVVGSVYLYKFLAAVIVTVVAILGIMAASKWNVVEEVAEAKAVEKKGKK